MHGSVEEDHQGCMVAEPTQLGSVTSRPGVHHIPGPLHHRSTILSTLGPDYALTVLFLGTHTRTSQWVTHHGSALARYSLNFGVHMEPEASELPKGLTLGRDKNIHIRITPLGDVGSHNPPPLGARRPRRHTTARVRLWYQSDTPRPRYSPNTRMVTCWPTPEGDESHLLSTIAENKE